MPDRGGFTGEGEGKGGGERKEAGGGVGGELPKVAQSETSLRN